jgi:hypothetical protein
MGGQLGNETWTSVLARESQLGDLTASYWAFNADRMRLPNVSMLQGHVDTSSVLVARTVRGRGSGSFEWSSAYLLSFMKPFTFRLWAALLAVIVCSGVVDYLTERTRVKETTLGKNTRVASHYSSPRNRQSIHLTLTRAPVLVILLVLTAASLYEYFAGFLWGGFAYPLSRMSAICTRPHVWIQPCRILHPAPLRSRRVRHSHAQLRVACEQRTDQIVGGFFFLVMISSCTREHWQREPLSLNLRTRERTPHTRHASLHALPSLSAWGLEWRADTANLAAFITVSARPTTSVASLTEAVRDGKTVCQPSLVDADRIQIMHPRLRLSRLNLPPSFLVAPPMVEQLANQLVRPNQGCDGILTTLVEYRRWRAQPRYCNLVTVQTVWPQMGAIIGSHALLCRCSHMDILRRTLST